MPDPAGRVRQIAHLARSVSSALELERVLSHVTAAVSALRSDLVCAVRLVDTQLGGYRLAGTGGLRVERRMPLVPFGQGLTHVVAETRRPLLVSDNQRDPRAVRHHWSAERRMTVYFGVPIEAGGELLGVLNVNFPAGGPPSDDEREMIEGLAGQAAVAIRNARVFAEADARRRAAEDLALENERLYAEATRRRREAEELAHLAKALTETLDISTVAERIVASLPPLFAAASSGLFLARPDGSLEVVAWGGLARQVFAAGQIFPAGAGLIGRTLVTGEAAWTADLTSDQTIVLPDELRALVAATNHRAVLAAPLRAKGRAVGVLSVGDVTARRFSADEIALLQAFADQAAVAIDNARLYDEAQRAYRDLEQAQARLVHGETLRALGQLAAGAAHHLNNLLAIVAGRVQLAEVKESLADVRRHLAIARRALDDSADVVRRLQEFSRAPAVASSVRVDLNGLVSEVLELTRPRWQDEPRRQGVSVEVTFEPGAIGTVAGEPAALREVLVNLVLNALDAMPLGGRLAVRTWKAGGSVCCAVEDTGVGMSPDVQRRALEPFFTTKGLKSTGLGLSVSYGVIRRQGGDLVVESRHGEGTTVTFRLPVHEAPSETTAPPPPPAPRPRRILLVEDTAEVRATLAKLLEEDGHRVIEAASGEEALARLDEDPAIDLVLTDLGMPGMNGWAVARAVKRRRPVPVVLVTGWGDESPPHAEDRAAVDLVLPKPVTSAALRVAFAGLPAGV